MTNKPSCPMCGQPMVKAAEGDRKGFGCTQCGVAFPVAQPKSRGHASTKTPKQASTRKD
jgi:tRNA(Ile2) C34 agmatinyltransferase TiaS